MGMEAQAEFSPHLKIRNLQVGGAEGLLAARLYAVGEAAGKRDTLIVFFHSGGFVGGDLDEGDTFLRHLADQCQHRWPVPTRWQREAFPWRWKMPTPCCSGRRRAKPN
jgi:acetyl esterase/lipase